MIVTVKQIESQHSVTALLSSAVEHWLAVRVLYRLDSSCTTASVQVALVLAKVFTTGMALTVTLSLR